MRITYNRRIAYMTLPQNIIGTVKTEGSVEQRLLSLLNIRRFGDELTDGEILFLKTNSSDYRYNEFNENQDTCWDRYGRYIGVNNYVLFEGNVYRVGKNLSSKMTIRYNNKEERLSDCFFNGVVLCDKSGETIEPPAEMLDYC